MNQELLTPIGTVGWFAMLVIGPIRRQQYGEILIPVIFGMAIIDYWAVAPAALRKDPSLSIAIYTWSGALFPYGVLVYWTVKAVISTHGQKTS